MIDRALGLALWSVVDWFLSRTNLGAGEADAGEADAGEADAGEADAGEADAGEADAGEADAGEADAGGASTGGAGSGTSSNQILRGAKRKAPTPSALMRFPVARSLRR